MCSSEILWKSRKALILFQGSAYLILNCPPEFSKDQRGSTYGNVHMLYEPHEVYLSRKILYFWVLDLLYTLSHAKERTKTHEHVTPIIKILGMYLHPTAFYFVYVNPNLQ